MKTPHMCITCKHYESYHCVLNDGYIGYLDCAEPTKCRAWRLSDDYKDDMVMWERGEKYDC